MELYSSDKINLKYYVFQKLLRLALSYIELLKYSQYIMIAGWEFQVTLCN